MKRLPPLLAVLVLITTSSAWGKDMLSVGTKSPEFQTVSSDGKDVSLSQLRANGPVVLVFARGFS
jgi:hypothetical protein